MAADPCEPASGGVSRWHVLQTEPAHEFEALSRVSLLPGVKPWLAIEVRRRFLLRNGRPVFERGRRVQEETIRPFFRGYLFAAFDPLSPAWAPLLRRNRETRTLRLFCDQAMRPLALPQGVVEGLQARGRAGDGAIDLEAVTPAYGPLQAGQRVRILDELLGEPEGVVQWTDQRRVEVLIGLLRVRVERPQVVVA